MVEYCCHRLREGYKAMATTAAPPIMRANSRANPLAEAAESVCSPGDAWVPVATSRAVSVGCTTVTAVTVLC